MDHPNKKSKKEHTLLNPDVSGVFVVNNPKKRAFIEQFNHASVNFTQKELGTLLGFFIVRDDSSSSENIVNFLTSEVKKYYFSPTQKQAEEKFESTLHRINRALEELANIGNVDWLGTIDGAVCVITQSSIHFSVTGNAHILLLRDNMLLHISDGLASQEATQYPLKTFVDISSGDIAAHDKIIITSPELLELVSFEELQKNLIRMGHSAFIQFIETVLTNECAIASTMVIDIQPLSRAAIVEPAFKEVPRNFFGAPATQDEQQNDFHDPNQSIDVTQYIEEPVVEEYTDPQTGHIYIHGTTEPIEKPSIIDQFTENAADLFDTLKEKTTKHRKSITKKISSITAKRISDVDATEEIIAFPEESVIPDDDYPAPSHNTFSTLKKKIIPLFQKLQFHCTKILHQSIALFLKTIRNISSFTKHLYTKDPSEKTYPLQEMPRISDRQKKSLITSILPRITHVASLWRSMKLRTKLIAISIIAFVVVTPLFLSRSNDDSKDSKISENNTSVSSQQSSTPTTPPTQTPPPTSSLPKEPTLTDPQVVYSADDTVTTSLYDDVVLSIEKKSVTVIDKDNVQKSFILPGDAGMITHATMMDDLSMLFILTDTDQIYTFSPQTKIFTKQENIPKIDHKKILHIGTYMTYLYLATGDTITRHTRIENGFDEGKEWLKEKASLVKTQDMAIGESIYFTDNGKIITFTQGKKDSFTQDAKIQSATLIYTSEDAEFLWIIDTKNNTLFKTKKKDGAVIAQFTHPDLSSAKSLMVNEKTKTIYLGSEKGISSFVITE